MEASDLLLNIFPSLEGGDFSLHFGNDADAYGSEWTVRRRPLEPIETVLHAPVASSSTTDGSSYRVDGPLQSRPSGRAIRLSAINFYH